MNTDFEHLNGSRMLKFVSLVFFSLHMSIQKMVIFNTYQVFMLFSFELSNVFELMKNTMLVLIII